MNDINIIMLVKLNGKEYQVNNNEFEHKPNESYSNLLIRKDIGYLERVVSLISELSSLSIKNLIIYNNNKGGYLPINCSKYYENITLIETNICLLYTSPSPRDRTRSRMPSSA